MKSQPLERHVASQDSPAGSSLCHFCALESENSDWRCDRGDAGLNRYLNPVNEVMCRANRDQCGGLTAESWASLDDLVAFKPSKSKGLCGCVCLMCPFLSGKEPEVNMSINFVFFEP